MKKIAIIGGGAAGMACAVRLAREGLSVTVLERGDRLGRKLSASGNGQGNVSNLAAGVPFYRTDDPEKLTHVLFSSGEIVSFLQSMGGIFLPDARGRIYPAGKQASAVTDLFRGELSRLGAETVFGAKVHTLAYGEKSGRFSLAWEGGHMEADAVVLAAGGKAAPNFGTDGSAYALAETFGHTVTPLSPALVPLKCDAAAVRGLKGIRVDAAVTVKRKGEILFEGRGDVLFADGGVSGDAVFRASSYAAAGDILELDLSPDLTEGELNAALRKNGFLCVLPNMLGRVVDRMAEGEGRAALVKKFPLRVIGDFGFSRAQVTRGGIPLSETDSCLQSKKRAGLYFAGEILNVDGDCGGFNLHFAFSSGLRAAEGICSNLR